jgi:hypothetical protein
VAVDDVAEERRLHDPPRHRARAVGAGADDAPGDQVDEPHEVGDDLVDRPRVDRARRADLHDLAGVHHRDAMESAIASD